MLPDITPSMGKWLKGGLGLFILIQLLVAGCEGKSFLQQQAGGGRPGEAVSPILPLPYSSGDYERNLVVGLPETGDTLMDDDGSSLESAIMNYLNTKRMIQRMKQQIDATSNSIQQRKRTQGNYWKMCAFNAVSCFG